MKKILPGICMFASLFAIGTLSGCNDKECEHQEEKIVGIAATCTEKGLTDGVKCGVCQEILVAQQEIAPLGHTEEKFEGKDATCTEAGNVAYTHCSVCDKNFDAEGNVLDKVVIDALGHTEEQVAAKDATCTEAGNVAHTHCSVCDKNFDSEGNALENVVIDALGHDGEQVEAKAPTCTEAGNVAYTHCTVCDKNVDAEGNVLDKVVIDALGHTEEQVEGKAATCTEAGYVAHTHCTVCDKNFDSEGKELETIVIEALGHKFIDGKCSCGEEYVAPLGEWTLTTELKNGDNVLIGAPAYNKLLSVEKVGTYYNKGVDYSSADYSKVTDAEIFVVTVNGDGTYTFTSLTGKVIALAASYSSLNDTGTHKSWALEERSEGKYYLKNTGRNMYLEWYASKNNWSAFNKIDAGSEGLFEISFYKQTGSTGSEHVHNYISDVHETTCTEDGYTTFTCDCGDNYREEGTKAIGHQYTPTVTAPTCTEDGYTTFTCSCGYSYTEKGETAQGHKYVDGVCSCGEEDPSLHKHEYKAEVTEPTCSAEGYTTYKCECGDSYVDEASKTPIAEHVDTNLDITCDFEGCTNRILPAADSKVSLFTANHMIIVSLSNSYYVEGTIVEVADAKNGMFIIEDEAGDQILIRMPKDKDGNSYSAWSTKLVVGDIVNVYGKPTRNTGSPATQKAKVEGGLLTVVKHEHNFSKATCTEPSSCGCLALGEAALGHIDEDANDKCDRCEWNMNLVVADIAVSTNTEKTNGILNEEKTSWTWQSENFDVIIAKGTSTVTLYTNAKDYMQLKKQNTLTVDNKNGKKIHSVTIYTTSASYLSTLKTVIGNTYTYTENAADFSVTITLDTTEDFVLVNSGTSTIYVSGVDVVYEK